MAAGAAALLCAAHAEQAAAAGGRRGAQRTSRGLFQAGRTNIRLRTHRLAPGGETWPRALRCGVALKKCNVIKTYLSPSLSEAEAVTHTTLL